MINGIRKTILLLMVCMFLVSYSTFASGDVVFTDIENHWAKDLIEKKYSEGLIEGYPDGTFKPDEALTKGQLIAIINRSFGLSNTEENHFADVSSNDWYKNEVDKAEYYKYIDGLRLKGDETATPKDAVMMVSHLLDLQVDEENMEIKDLDKLNSEEEKMFKMFEELGYMNSKANEKIDPDKKLNRAEILSITDNVLGYIVRSQEDVSNIPPNAKLTIIGQNIVLDGVAVKDIYVSPGVHSSLKISNSKISGKINISLDKGKNKLILEDTKVKKIKVSDRSDGLGLQLKGKTRVDELRIENNGSVNSDNKAYIVDMIVDKGNLSLDHLDVKHDLRILGGDIVLIDSHMDDVIIQGKSHVQLDKKSDIKDLDVEAESDIEGEGKIYDAYIHNEGVSLDIRPNTTRVEDGVTTNIVGRDVKGISYESKNYSKNQKTKNKKERKSHSNTPTNIVPTGIVISGVGVVEKGSEVTLVPSVQPSNSTNKNVEWSSSDESIATINNGIVSGISLGTVNIECKTVYGSIKSVHKITVVSGPTDGSVFNIEFNDVDSTCKIIGFSADMISDNPVDLIFSSKYLKDDKEYILNKIEGHSFYQGSMGFKNRIGTVVFPDTIEEIGVRAFANNNISSVKFPESIKKIGEEAFYENNISAVEIPSSVKNLEQSIFYGNKLESVILNEGLESIGEMVFVNNLIEEIDFPKTLKTIGNQAFKGNKLECIIIYENIITLGDGSFKMSGNVLNDVTIEGDSTRFDSDWIKIGFPPVLRPMIMYEFIVDKGPSGPDVGLLKGFSSDLSEYPEKIVIPSTCMKEGSSYDVIAILSGAFQSENINEIEIPSTVEYIFEDAFANTMLKSITIPESVKVIEDGAFINTPHEKLIILGEDKDRFNKNWTEIGFKDSYGIEIGDFKVSSDGDGGASIEGFSSDGKDKDIKNLEIPETIEYEGEILKVVAITSNAFNNEKYDKSLEIKSVTLPQNLKTIKEKAFYGNDIDSIVIPENVLNIYDEAFSNNDKLVTVEIYGVADRFNDKWSDIGFPSDEKPDKVYFTVSVDYENGNVAITGFSQSGINREFSDLVIPSNFNYNGKSYEVNKIAVDAFNSSKYEYGINFKSLTIPDTIVEIEVGSFANNSKLTSVIIEGDNPMRFNELWTDIGFNEELKPSIPK